ncbi:hypothetical protein OPKNFCMD_3277 [Methylobacterium crusticola]|uniref:Resolvase/invertase-type recombinase catalytic domain-containing protein n=1 Tax=Methylobacterium crusticola TaxID=1697972 RepID=A0ABQ4QZD6_9HYPH|nr:hypothetical protein OPKNFCMD_3277 [Methylobacterium crusticola]
MSGKRDRKTSARNTLLWHYSDMLIGYARVSTTDQNLDLQRDALTGAGCSRTFEEKKSGKAGSKRPEFEAAHEPSFARCCQLMCCHDLRLLQERVLGWRGTGVTFKIAPVVPNHDMRKTVMTVLDQAN